MTDRPDPKALIDSVKTDVIGMGKNFVALGMAEVKPRAKAAGIMGGMFGAAGYLAINAVSLLFLAGAAGFAALFHLWLGPFGSAALGLVAMALVLLLIAAVLGFVGKGKIDDVKQPVETPDVAKRAVGEVKSGIERGQHLVDAEIEASKHEAIEPTSTPAPTTPRTAPVPTAAAATTTTHDPRSHGATPVS